MSEKKSVKPFVLNWIAPLILVFGIIYVYFAPLLGGKVIQQDDIMFAYAKTQQTKEYRETKGEEPFWTDAMFSGMPTFQLSTAYPNNWLGALQSLFGNIFGNNSWLYTFPIMAICFFLLARSYGVDPWLSAVGTIAFCFSAFFVVSFGAGHVAKVRTAAYLPLIIMGIVLTYRGWWKSGAAATALGVGLSVVSNHFQITFYTLIIALSIGVVYLVHHIKEKKTSTFIKRSIIILAAAIIGAAPNIGNLWSTMSYSKETIRGGNTKLVTKDAGGADKEVKEGLGWDYAMMWSYGKAETLNLFIPFFSGGGAKQTYEGTKTYDRLESVFRQQGMSSKNAETTANQYAGSILYWGDQSMVNGAYYVGASLIFLFVLGLILIKSPTRGWIIASALISLFLAWGSNLEFFNRFVFEHIPLYNKFRVPSMALVIIFFLVPITAVLALNEVVKGNIQQTVIKKKLLLSLYITGGLAILIALIGPSLFELSSVRDQQFIQQGFAADMLIDDRASLMRSSAFKSLLFVALSFGALWLYVIGKLKRPMLAGILIVIVCIDLIPFDRDQLGKDEFISQTDMDALYQPTQADNLILKDTDIHYRVFNTSAGLTSDKYTSYFHKSIGGYHGAKLARYQDLIEHQLQKNNMACFNMLNTKWFIVQDQQGNQRAQPNVQACGNAWFVNDIKLVDGPNAEMNALSDFDPNQTVIIDSQFSDYTTSIAPPDSGIENTIILTSYDPKHLIYSASVSSPEALAVFSEIYYEAPGQEWHAYIDGEEVDFIRVNYLLRGLKVPQGIHEVEFKFIPQTYIMGEKIDLIASIILFGGLIVLIFLGYKDRNKKAETTV